MDEPFSSLDFGLREQLAREVGHILRNENISALLVTHDQNEAFAMGDNICILNKGRVQQDDTPYNIYHNPTNQFVARFIGDGVLIPGVINSLKSILTSFGEIDAILSESFKINDKVAILVRPENVILDKYSKNIVVIEARYFRGANILYKLKTTNEKKLLCLLSGLQFFELGQSIAIKLKIDNPIFFSEATTNIH